jgi:predicted nucleic-acid-binding protein
MIGLDTNVIVRFLTADDEAQFAAATELLDANDTFVPLTVTLEVEWVLRSRYKLGTKEVIAAYEGLLGLPRMTFEHRDRVATALGLAAAGFEFADALHASSSGHCSSFATFDVRFATTAERHGLRLVSRLEPSPS